MTNPSNPPPPPHRTIFLLRESKKRKEPNFKLFNSLILWGSMKQTIMDLSSCKMNYIAIYNTVYQGVWLLYMLIIMKIGKEEEIELTVDEKSIINLAKSQISYGKRKHVEIIS